MTSNKQVKPKDLKFEFADCWISNFTGAIKVLGWNVSLSQAKKIHKWLGQAIAFLEHQEKKGE